MELPESEFMRFVKKPAPGVTMLIDVVSKSRGDLLGVVRWYGPWRCYVFIPAHETIFNGKCLQDVFDLLGRLMADRRERAALPRNKESSQQK